MAVRTLIQIFLLLAVAGAGETIPFLCPMHPDIRASTAGRCPRCGMQLVANLADPLEYLLDIGITPPALQPGRLVHLTFRVSHPQTGRPVTGFELVHEKIFHLFIVSQDLRFFAHEHPRLAPDGTFRLDAKLRSGGQYRLLCDFYPSGGTPQLIPKTIIAVGRGEAAHLHTDLAPREAVNTQVSLTMDPAVPIAGKKTMLFFHLQPAEGLEPYLGARGHLLAASEDLIDLLHGHPAFDDPGPTVQFNVIFPRPGMHRVWVQFQRNAKVNTVAFNIPVSGL
ncbi:MAG TPA: heavy metal-binding domain-containing protein [Bryobacteraceae bacterium]|nr:heavy metal-binding domain-containing protein [Bryobacteraceae bacterium]